MFIENNTQRKTTFQGTNAKLGAGTAGQSQGRASDHESPGYPPGGIPD